MSILDFGSVAHSSFDHTIKEIKACNSLLDLVNTARSDYVLADRLRNCIRKQLSSLNRAQVVYIYIMHVSCAYTAHMCVNQLMARVLKLRSTAL
jgi:hypothetical protein